METVTNLKYGRLAWWSSIVGFFLSALFEMTVLTPSESAPVKEVVRVLFLFAVSGVTARILWQRVAKDGIRVAQQVTPGILCAAGLGPLFLIGVVQLCLAKHHGCADLKAWGVLWIVLTGLLFSVAFIAGIVIGWE